MCVVHNPSLLMMNHSLYSKLYPEFDLLLRLITLEYLV